MKVAKSRFIKNIKKLDLTESEDLTLDDLEIILLI